jgi:hypothetical protein
MGVNAGRIGRGGTESRVAMGSEYHSALPCPILRKMPETADEILLSRRQ